MIELKQIRTNGGTQPRESIDEATVAAYKDALDDGATFPPVVVFHDGDAYWLADGFHRVRAAREAGRTEIAAEVKQGTVRDAILYSVGANATHGLRRTREDKRRAVSRLLQDPEWSRWSDREIARQCRVHHQLVGRLRTTHLDDHPDAGADARLVRRGDQVYEQRTAAIGGRADPEPPPTAPTPEERASFAMRELAQIEAQHPEVVQAVAAEVGPKVVRGVRAAVRRPRNDNDAYYTRVDVARACLTRIHPRAEERILEAHVGGGAWLEALAEYGIEDVDVLDVDPDAPGLRGRPAGDFLTHDFGEREYDLIVGNPPYKTWRAHLEKAWSVLAFGGQIAWLLRRNCVDADDARDLLEEICPRTEHIIRPRPSFTGDGNTDGQAYSFFVWRKGGPRQRHWMTDYVVVEAA